MPIHDGAQFEAHIDAALKRVRRVLDNTRNPQYPAKVPHRYDDKYLLAEFVTRISAASILQCFEMVGMTAVERNQLRGWAAKRSVTVRLAAREECRFLRETTRNVESGEVRVTETRGFLGGKASTTDRVVTKVTEYFWAFEVRYDIVAFPGTSTKNAITLRARSGSIELKTTQKTTPRPMTVVKPPIDVNLTWLFTHLDAEGRATFAIDRAADSCHTPRRNDEIEEALWACEEISTFCGAVASYFQDVHFSAQSEHGLDLSAIDDSEVFVPVLPLFEAEPRAEEGEGLLPVAYANAFLAEEHRTLTEKCRELATAFPHDGSLITAEEACLLVTLLHAGQVCQRFADGVAYIEGMLREQLVAAIGKEVSPVDFTSYIDFHHRKLVKPEYRPRPFSYAIRRPDHDPEGVLCIEAERAGALPEAISTTVRRSEARTPMTFALDASTRVSFLGERYLHAWVSHQFSFQPGPTLSLVARARQFSSFLLLVGRIAAADVFEPQFGIILQNKDTLRIPLLLEPIPTPGDFRDAIESLSPEQQRFARAYRGMQLESTLFGVCVIQIKPQLEKLLKLPQDSLTKEIRLTQKLLSLFIEYQIPSDLLSYDGPPEATPDEKLTCVTKYVTRIQEVIDRAKKHEIEEEREREAKRLAEQSRTPMLPPTPPMIPPAASSGFAPTPRPAMARERLPVYSAVAPPTAPLPAPVAEVTAPHRAPEGPTRAATRATERPAVPGAPPSGFHEGGEPVDYTRIPGELDRSFEALDTDGALRATLINPGSPWTRSTQKGLLGSPVTTRIAPSEQKTEQSRAFDLLDALSKSGALPIEDASLHVVIGATHCFDRTLTDTVIQDNVNPIEKVERSLLIVGTTIHRRPAGELLADDQRERFLATSPHLGAAQLGDGAK